MILVSWLFTSYFFPYLYDKKKKKENLHPQEVYKSVASKCKIFSIIPFKKKFVRYPKRKRRKKCNVLDNFCMNDNMEKKIFLRLFLFSWWRCADAGPMTGFCCLNIYTVKPVASLRETPSSSLSFFFFHIPVPPALPCRHTWDREIRFPGENVTGFRRRSFFFQSFAFVDVVVKANLKATPFFCQSTVRSFFCNTPFPFFIAFTPPTHTHTHSGHFFSLHPDENFTFLQYLIDSNKNHFIYFDNLG